MRKLISKKREKCPYSKDTYVNKLFLVNEEDYLTSNNIKFKLKTYEHVLEDKDGDERVYYTKTDVEYKNKVVIGNDGIPGSMSKAKKWLEKNDEYVLGGGGYRYKSS